MAALKTEREAAIGIAVEGHSQLLQVGDRRGGFSAKHLRRRASYRAAPGRDRVREMTLRRIVVGDRGGQASLGPVGRGLGKRRGRDEDDGRPLTRGTDRRVEAGRATTDDGNLGFEPIQPQVRYLRMPCVFLSHPSSLEHETGGHPERAERIAAIEVELLAAELAWL